MSTSTRRNAPAPTRKEIVDYLNKRGRPADNHNLFQAFAVRKGRRRDEMLERLDRMQAQGQILVDRRGRYFLPDRVDMMRGTLIGHPDGYGFLRPEGGGEDMYLSPKEMRKALHGDLVLAKLRRIDRRGRREGVIIEVLERVNQRIVGRLHVENNMAYVVPDNQRISQDVFVPEDALKDAKHGQIVTVEVLTQPDVHRQPVGRVVEVLGEHLESGMETEIAIRKHGIPAEWGPGLEREAASVSGTVELSADRVDLRSTPLVTIDGADARDFDDAVYARETGGGWELTVAIADVSHYVKPGSALDREAFLRGNSVYFPRMVVPMLPETLSNGLCSLNPEVDRFCFACVMQIDGNGQITGYSFKKAVMRSHARLTYDQVAAALVDQVPAQRDGLKHLVPALECLSQLARCLNRRRSEQGTIELEMPETRIVFDQSGRIENIEPTKRNDAHRLIEECMLAANICAADFLIKREWPGLFRIHEKPDPDKVEDLRAFLQLLGISLGGGAHPEAADYARVVADCGDGPHQAVVSTALLRSMNQAVYSAEPAPHFALGFERYAHFTSPIRRYPDLVVHRMIQSALQNPASADEVDLDLTQCAAHCSMTERRADEATRDVIQWLKAEYMRDRVGEEFAGIVSGVAEFGVFVELEDVYVEGLIHVTALGEDYFHYDPVSRSLTGEHSGQTFKLGMSLQVRLIRVDLDQARVDFELTKPVPGDKGRRRRKRR